MTPLPGLRFSVAPRFHLTTDWAERLDVGTGVSETDGHFFPRGPWRRPTADELASLISGPEFDPEEDSGTVALFQTPGHLRAAWWDLLDKSVEAGGGALPGFEGFVGRVAEFLRFKGMEVPSAVRMEAVVTAPGERSIRRDAQTGGPAGLGPSLAPWAGCDPSEHVVPRLWAVVSLGDEDTRLVLIDPPIRELRAKLARQDPGGPPPLTVGELVKRFLREQPDCRPVRLRLGPGEGILLPSGGLILDGDATDKQEPDVLLLISEEPLPSPGG